MLWKGRRESSNVEDRRGISGRTMVAGGGIGTVVLVILYLLLGGGKGDELKNILPTTGGSSTEDRQLTAAEKEQGDFVSVILAETEDVWHSLFNTAGKTYREPKLVLFSGMTQSGCGYAQAAVGPFYCSGDQTVYIDLDFLSDLQSRLGAQGDFAVAYIIAHEVGHHVQNLLGIMDQVQQQRTAGLDERESNDLSVRMELQADFLAGVWAYHAQRTKNLLEEGDVDEAVNAAGAVGDDRIQNRTQGYVVPDSFTHGTSAQRKNWFLKGFKSGDPDQGDTFNAPNL
jgi:predicted metalloprotease